MTRRALRLVFRATAAAALLGLGSGAVWSADPNRASVAPQLSKEAREKMALMHEKMAACLRSDKSMAECRIEMAKNCRDILGPEYCPMPTTHHRKTHAPSKGDSGG